MDSPQNVDQRTSEAQKRASASNQNGIPSIESVSSLPVNPDVTITNIQPAEARSVRPAAEGLPVWLQRVFLVIFVVLCVEVGLVLVAVPWTTAWSDNSLLIDFPRLQGFLRLGFVRGIVSGIGMLDIWIGIWEAVHYRDRRPN